MTVVQKINAAVLLAEVFGRGLLSYTAVRYHSSGITAPSRSDAGKGFIEPFIMNLHGVKHRTLNEV